MGAADRSAKSDEQFKNVFTKVNRNESTPNLDNQTPILLYERVFKNIYENVVNFQPRMNVEFDRIELCRSIDKFVRASHFVSIFRIEAFAFGPLKNIIHFFCFLEDSIIFDWLCTCKKTFYETFAQSQ